MKDLILTDRLYLRPWNEDDAEVLYKYASDDRVGPACGWTVHKDVEESRRVIRDILSAPETYAMCDKVTDEPIGSIALMKNDAPSHIEGDLELGYWLAVPYWGRGLTPEAVRRMLLYAFDELGTQNVWIGYFDGNEKSKRVAEKCGFRFIERDENVPWPATGETKNINYSRISKEEFYNDKNI